MYKLEFTLKQHTPLIHFQHDQAGATLRATEVKPKLDQFLFEKLTGKVGFDARIEFHRLIFSDIEEWKQKKNWLIGNANELKPNYESLNERNVVLSHLALNYKLSFHCQENHSGEIQEIIYKANGAPDTTPRENKIKVKSFPAFFGNNGNETIEEFKWFSWTDYVKAKFIIIDYNLFNNINKYFSSFIFYNNWGTRKTKGFGSFTVLNELGNSVKPKKASKYYFDIELPNIQRNAINQIIQHYNNHGYGNISQHEALYLLENRYLFEKIELLYKSMRSGINATNRNAIPCTNDSRFYLKSFLFFYFKERFNIQWDKKSIKEHFYSRTSCLTSQKTINTDTDNPINFNDTLPINDKKLIRDLLGLSTEQSCMSYNNDTITKSSLSNINSEPIYNRFMSPIRFKPIRLNTKFRVFIEYEEFPNELTGKQFAVDSKNNPRLYPLILTYPISFSIRDYFWFLFEEKNTSGHYIVDLENYIQTDFQNEYEDSEYTILSNIFNSIRSNLEVS
jgi:FtsZ-binding cell division protein ZapB